MADYNLPYEGEEIEERLKYGILASRPMNLTESQKAQARVNIGAGTSSSGLQIRGYFDTYEELKATITNPSVGDTYAVGTEAPYSIYIWDVLNRLWVNNGYVRGADGKDAILTPESISEALGYTPANADNNIPSDGTVSTNYTATIGTEWSGPAAPYSIDVAINGILESDTPFIDLAPAENFTEAEQQIEAWGYVYRAVTVTNTITFYATEKPTVSIPIKIKVIRK